MSPESLLAEKLNSYRGAFDKACRELFSGGEGVTLEYEQDDGDDAVDVGAGASGACDSEPVFENSNRGSKSARAVREAVRWIADDFAHEFNAKLAAAAKSDPTVELVADKYEMGPEHVVELDALLAAPVQALLRKLDAGDLDGARRATLEAWPALEKRIRSKWQAYFVMTFQDVSVERKAARDRRKLQPRFEPMAMETMAKAESVRNSMPDFAAPADDRPARTAWLYVAALLLVALAGGWLLLHHTH
jgi:hypothetical protein